MNVLGGVAHLHGRLVHPRRVHALVAHLVDILPRSHRVLDVGCGDGLIDRLILDRRPDLTICGVDSLVRPSTHIPVKAYDGRTLPFREDDWDTVLFCDVLHHTHDVPHLLREAVRVARQSVVIKDHYADGVLARPILRFMDVVGNAPYGVVLSYNYLTSQEWDRVFADVGLTPVVKRLRLGLYPWWAEPVFGGRLHFLARLDVRKRSRT